MGPGGASAPLQLRRGCRVSNPRGREDERDAAVITRGGEEVTQSHGHRQKSQMKREPVCDEREQVDSASSKEKIKHKYEKGKKILQ